MQTVFLTGATGYIGTRLIKKLLEDSYHVVALIRAGSERKVPAGAEIIVGDPFNATNFQPFIATGSVFVQLLGVAHPSPKKAQLFSDIDLRSVKTSADAALNAGVSHFIYVSVAMEPSRLMGAYQQARKEGEAYCLSKGFNCTFIRPWYVIGPGHWWPLLLLPFYGFAELFPALRKRARTRALVSIEQMLRALTEAIQSTPSLLRIMEITDIRQSGNNL